MSLDGIQKNKVFGTNIAQSRKGVLEKVFDLWYNPSTLTA
jgi:hypothetical protein